MQAPADALALLLTDIVLPVGLSPNCGSARDEMERRVPSRRPQGVGGLGLQGAAIINDSDVCILDDTAYGTGAEGPSGAHFNYWLVGTIVVKK